MNRQAKHIQNEEGYVTIFALLVLVMLTTMGISGVTTSSTEMQIATNDSLYKMTFYNAETARSYVMMNPDLYGADNIDAATPHLFPNNSDPYVPITVGPVAPFNLGPSQSFSGTVEYVGGGGPPRESGYDTSKFRAHQYRMTCIGTGHRNTTARVEAGFYRIGL